MIGRREKEVVERESETKHRKKERKKERQSEREREREKIICSVVMHGCR